MAACPRAGNLQFCVNLPPSLSFSWWHTTRNASNAAERFFKSASTPKARPALVDKSFYLPSSIDHSFRPSLSHLQLCPILCYFGAPLLPPARTSCARGQYKALEIARATDLNESIVNWGKRGGRLWKSAWKLCGWKPMEDLVFVILGRRIGLKACLERIIKFVIKLPRFVMI